jgi:hypothetical protein
MVLRGTRRCGREESLLRAATEAGAGAENAHAMLAGPRQGLASLLSSQYSFEDR